MIIYLYYLVSLHHLEILLVSYNYFLVPIDGPDRYQWFCLLFSRQYEAIRK